MRQPVYIHVLVRHKQGKIVESTKEDIEVIKAGDSDS